MNNPYDLHSWSKLYREEALGEASIRQQLRQAKAERRTRSARARAASTWASVLSLLSGAELSTTQEGDSK